MNKQQIVIMVFSIALVVILIFMFSEKKQETLKIGDLNDEQIKSLAEQVQGKKNILLTVRDIPRNGTHWLMVANLIMRRKKISVCITELCIIMNLLFVLE